MPVGLIDLWLMFFHDRDEHPADVSSSSGWPRGKDVSLGSRRDPTTVGMKAVSRNCSLMVARTAAKPW
jgi:hypothetical protein